MEREEIERAGRELDEILGRMEAGEGRNGQTMTDEREPREDVCGDPEEAVCGTACEDPEDDVCGTACGTEAACTEEPRLRLLRPSDGLLAAFFVPVIVMVIIFAQRGIFPFGEECFLRTDLYHQYAPFFSEFQYKLRSGGSLLYSWDIGMGVNFSALYAYYLASPLNWLILLCPRHFIIEFMTLMIVLKTALSSLSFTWYLGRHCGRRDFGACFFGIFYALSGYMAAYSWNIMWLDCIVLFPLILLGLERLVAGRSGLFYGITLGLAILSNYYISIMICIYMVIYAVALAVLTPPRGFKGFAVTAARFGGYSLLAGGLAAAVLLPEIAALQATASGRFDFPKTVTSYFSIFDMIARHIGNVGTETGLDHWPNIYCGVAVLFLVLLYMGSRRIAAREKIVNAVLLLFFYASFSVNVLNFIWHGFHYPNSLPCRQSFLYIALVLVMSYKAYTGLEETPLRQIVHAFWGSCGFVLLAEKLVDNPEQFHFSVFYAALLFLALYTGICWLYKRRRWGADAALLAALAVVTIESAVNLAVTSVPTTSRTAYVSDNDDARALAQGIKADGFYRVDKEDMRTKNDGAWLNFPSASLFSSVADASLSDFFKKLGCESSTNAYSITGSTPFVDSLFAVRYLITPQAQEDDGLRSLVDFSGDLSLYENRFTLPAAFMLPRDVETNWLLDSSSPVTVQNDICSLLDTGKLLLETEGKTEGNRFCFTAAADGRYYVYVTNHKVEQVSAVIGERSASFDNVDRGYLLELGWAEAGTEISLQTNDEGGPLLQAEAYRFDPQALEAVYSRMNRNPLQLTRWTDTAVEGTITADEAGTMFTSIPYDKGWTLRVDGKEHELRPVFDTFLAADLPAGTHQISLSYRPQGLREGIWISAASAAALAAAAGWQLAGKRKSNR